jgi:Septum formation
MWMKSRRTVFTAAAVLSVVLAACGDPTQSEEYQALLAERDAAQAGAQLAEERADLAESELASLTTSVEEFLTASLGVAGFPTGEAACLMDELGIENFIAAALAGVSADPAATMQSMNPAVLGEITAAGLACGSTGFLGEEPTGSSVFDLKVGDCFNDDPAGGTVVNTVATVDCGDPHDNEVYFVFDMTDAAFPGSDASIDAGSERCIAEFEGFVGISYIESDLDVFPITPTAESWDQGDREVLCALYALDLSKLTGSMEGAAH